MSKDCEVRCTGPLVVQEDQARAATRPGGEPIVILPASKGEVSARAILFLTVSDLVPFKATCAYLYRKSHILFRQFRVWDDTLRTFRASRGAHRLRWFVVDRRNHYQLLHIRGI